MNNFDVATFKPKWSYSIQNGLITFKIPNDTSIWFRFWTRFFFGGAWEKL